MMSNKAIHSARLERWLGAAEVESVSQGMRDWYGPPIAVAGVPGAVYAHAGGDFAGDLRGGWEATALDYVRDFGRRVKRAHRRSVRNSHAQMNAGFSSLSDLISEATAGAKRREFAFQKTGTLGVVNGTNSLWLVGTQPSAGAIGSAAPGGRAPTSATAGAFPFANPTGGDTQHFVTGAIYASVAPNTLLLYDRIFDVAKTASSTASQSVTGVPTRYQSSTATDANYAGGNFCFVEASAQLGNTAHNWTVCRYRNQAGTDAISFPSMAGNNQNLINRLDHPLGLWFFPLAAGDSGVMDLDQIQCSASVTGVPSFVIGHPIAWFPCPLINMVTIIDGISTAFSLTRIFDDACLSFLEINKAVTTLTNYGGQFITVAG